MAPGPEQVSGSPQPPTSQTGQGVSPFLIIGIVVVILLLLVGVGSLFYNLGQQNNSKPGTTPTPGITPTPTPTPAVTPTLTPKITPTPTAFKVPASSIAVFLLSAERSQMAMVRQENSPVMLSAAKHLEAQRETLAAAQGDTCGKQQA